MNTKAVLALILCCASWGITFPIIKAVMIELREQSPNGSSLFFASWIQMARFLLAGVIMFFLTIHLKRPTALEIRQGLIIGFWGGIGMWLQADALAYTEASTSAFLTQCYCIFLPLWVAFRDRRLPGKTTIIPVTLVLVGGAILAGITADEFTLGRGELLTILSALFFTVQMLVIENPKYTKNRGRSVSLIMFVGISIIFLPITFFAAPSLASVIIMGSSSSIIILITIVATVCTVGSFWLMNAWQRHVTATEAGIIYTSEPVFAACYVLFLPSILASLMGHSYANETLTSKLIIGGALIITANFVVVYSRKKSKI